MDKCSLTFLAPEALRYSVTSTFYIMVHRDILAKHHVVIFTAYIKVWHKETASVVLIKLPEPEALEAYRPIARPTPAMTVKGGKEPDDKTIDSNNNNNNYRNLRY